MNAALTLDNLTLSYHRHPVVHHVSGSFVKGELTAIVGPNGAGKSSLLRAIAGLMPIHEGRIDFGEFASGQMAFLAQQAVIARDFPITVQDAVLLGDWQRSGWFARVSRQARVRADEALAKVGLAGFGNRTVDELSAGQFQRVLFARLMLQDAQLILLDEPFTALDARTTTDLLAIVSGWKREGRTVIAVLHDYQQVGQYFPQTLLLSKECIAWGNTAEVMTAENIARANNMPAAWDEHAPICAQDAATGAPASKKHAHHHSELHSHD